MSTLSIPVTRKLRNIASVKRNIRVECVHWSLTKCITVRWRRLEHRACVCLTLSAHKRITAEKLAHAWVQYRYARVQNVLPSGLRQQGNCIGRLDHAYFTVTGRVCAWGSTETFARDSQIITVNSAYLVYRAASLLRNLKQHRGV